MPALPNVSKVVRLDLIHSEQGDPSLGNRSYWTYTGSDPSISNMNDLAGFAEGFWASYFKPMCNTVTNLVKVVATDLTSPTSSRGEWTGSTAGTRAGVWLSINDVALINFGISRRYRGGKPRIYAPWGVGEDLQTVQTWNSTFISEATDAWTSFHGSMVGQGFGSCAITSQVNVSYYEGFVSAQNPVTLRWRTIPTVRTAALVDVIDTFACSPTVGSQRRRVRA